MGISLSKKKVEWVFMMGPRVYMAEKGKSF
jgi:hypothetical protein